MRRNSSTVVVLAGPAPDEVLAAVGRSMNVALIRPEEPADSGADGIQAAARALQRAGRATSPYALVAADPLAAVAASWRAMWDVSRQPGPAEFEQEAAKGVFIGFLSVEGGKGGEKFADCRNALEEFFDSAGGRSA